MRLMIAMVVSFATLTATMGVECQTCGNENPCADVDYGGTSDAPDADSVCAMIAAAYLVTHGEWHELAPVTWPANETMPPMDGATDLVISEAMHLHAIAGLPPPARQYYEWRFSVSPTIGDLAELVVPPHLPDHVGLGPPNLTLYGPYDGMPGIPWLLTRSGDPFPPGVGAWGSSEIVGGLTKLGASYVVMGPSQLNWMDYTDSYPDLEGQPIQWTTHTSVLGYVTDFDTVVAGRGWDAGSKGELTFDDGLGFMPFAGWCVRTNAPGQDSTG